MGNRGIVYSTDLMVAFVAVSAIVFVIVAFSSASLGKISQNFENFSREREAIFFMDYLVKAHVNEPPVIGAAFFDAEKKRVVGNVLDVGMLRNAAKEREEIKLEHQTVKGIFLQYKNTEKEWIFGGNEENCVIYERFVLVRGILMQKAKVGAVFCE